MSRAASSTWPDPTDPFLKKQTLTGPGGILANTQIVVKAEPQYGVNWLAGTAYPRIGTCATDAQGHPAGCALNLSAVQGNGSFDQRGVVTYDVWYPNNGQLQFGFRTEEYVECRLGCHPSAAAANG